MNTDYNILSDYLDVLCPNDITKILSVGKNTVYKLLKYHTIQSIKIGKQYKIPKVFVIQYLLTVN